MPHAAVTLSMSDPSVLTEKGSHFFANEYALATVPPITIGPVLRHIPIGRSPPSLFDV